MELSKGFRQLVAEAESQVKSLSPAEVELKLQAQTEGLLLIDLRDVREVKREGKIPASLHIPRGMLEFWIDPDSPYYRSEFDQAKEIILYCNKGWRSALAAQTLQNMGVENVAHLQGGMEQWQAENGRIEQNK
ncbi:MAG: rhodanese-like domain-containing protein [Pseudohongiella sp.]|jgi:rhodanese-related sulfurtransferase|nr:rhodanese-like domain-containing protein [Pseudohongiella sp.]